MPPPAVAATATAAGASLLIEDDLEIIGKVAGEQKGRCEPWEEVFLATTM